MSDQNEMREQFYGYYISLYATGVPEVDAVLEAVAGAAHGYHHTEDWNDGQERGTSAVQSIQAAAQAAADAFRATPAPQAAPSDADIQRIGKSLPAFQNMGYRLLTGQQMTKPEREDYEAHIKFARYVLAAAPAVAITQAATSEPVAMPQVELDASLDTWMDVELKDVPTWQRKGFNVRTLYAAPVAHLAGTTPNTEAPSDAKLWSLIDEYADARGEYQHSTARHLAKTQRENVEHAKAEVIAALSAQQAGGLTDARILEIAAEQDYGDEDPKCITRLARAFEHEIMKQARLPAQQAGVQEAPSEDAKDAARLKRVLKPFMKLVTELADNPATDRIVFGESVTLTVDDFRKLAALAAATQTEKP